MTKKLIRVSPMLNCLTVQTYYKQTVLVSGPVLPILLIQVKILRYFCCLNVLWALKIDVTVNTERFRNCVGQILN